MPQTVTKPKYDFSDRTKYDALMEVVRHRVTTHAFDASYIMPHEHYEMILDAARHAPSAALASLAPNLRARARGARRPSDIGEQSDPQTDRPARGQRDPLAPAHALFSGIRFSGIGSGRTMELGRSGER